MSKPGNTPSWRTFDRSWRSLWTAIDKGVLVTMPDGRRVQVRGLLPAGASLIATPKTRGCCENRDARPLCTAEGVAPHCRSRLDVTAPIDRAGKRHLDIVTPRTSLADFRDLGSRPVCALDVANEGEHSVAAVAKILNLDPRSIQLIEARALGKTEATAKRDPDLAEEFRPPHNISHHAPEPRALGVLPPLRPVASLKLTAEIAGRRVEVTANHDASRALLVLLRDARVSSLRDLWREMRDAMAETEAT